MSARILIVEDEMLVAMNMEAVIEYLGYTPVGIATDTESALSLAAQGPDVALVDVNLRDGATGPDIGTRLARDHGISVLFVTGNPRQIGDAADDSLGVMTKPVEEEQIEAALAYATNHRRGVASEPPGCVQRVTAG